MSNYHDRGILKWAPFDALTGQQSVLEELIYNINKKEKTSLSDDETDEMNAIFNEAHENKKIVTIDYYSDGYTLTTFGKIKMVDSVKNTLILDTEEEISISDILQIHIVR